MNFCPFTGNLCNDRCELRIYQAGSPCALKVIAENLLSVDKKLDKLTKQQPPR